MALKSRKNKKRSLKKVVLSELKIDVMRELIGLRDRNKELNIKLMKKSAEASEARETLRQWAIEIERVADQRGHNLCFIDLPRLFVKTVGDRGGYPDFDGITQDEFEAGCKAYQVQLFAKARMAKPPER